MRWRPRFSSADSIWPAATARRIDDVLAVVTPDDEQRRPQVFGRYRGVRLEIA